MEHVYLQFIDAGTLMLAGMVFVFAFLGLLVVFINNVLVRLAEKYPDPIPQTRSRPTIKKSADKAGEISPGVVAAISSAVTRYRHQHNNSK
jgi:oxaloacetate decarboxylase gamma subunit